MMKFFLFCILICFSVSGFSQNSVIDLLEKNGQCKYSAESFSVIFANYLRMNLTDSAKAVLDKWEKNCNSSEPLQRAKIILALKTNSFNENIYNKSIRVRFIERLRDEKRFSGPEELANQIRKDVEQAKEILRQGLRSLPC